MVSELEGVILGLVGRYQPCTAYRIRMTLTDSPSTFWSGSAGAVYPALRRLQAAGLVGSTTDKGSGRGRKVLGITRAGTEALRGWVLDGATGGVVSGVFDPVRSRTFFLNTLSEPERVAFSRECLAALERYRDRTTEDIRNRATDEGYAHAALGAVFEAEARIAWMREVIRLQERAVTLEQLLGRLESRLAEMNPPR